MLSSKALAVQGSPNALRYVKVARCALAVLAVQAAAAGASAQTAPAPAIRVTFKEAIDRAMEKNPTVAAAASGILAAEGLIRQARAATLIRVTSDITWTNLNRGVEFEGATVTPQSQVTASVPAGQPILAGATWARRAQ